MAPAAPPKVTTMTMRYHGTGGSLFSLVLLNGLLSIATLGLYSFWARSKVREFHYSHTELDGDRFAYHGTGKELWIGSIKASFVLFAVFIGLSILANLIDPGGQDPTTVTLLTLAIYGIIGLLIPIAVNGARRYRLSRSSWRGIRFSYHGRWQEYLALSAGGAFLSVVTLGLYLPIFQNRKQEYLVSNTQFGSEPFLYRGSPRDLYPEYLKALVLTIPTLGLSWVWYAAFKHRFFWMNTMMRGARFRSTVTGGELLTLSLTNIAMTVFTLGLAVPWVQTRTHAFFCDRLSLRGTVEWAQIEQRAQQAGTAHEGLADALDVDIGIG
jgi:uncharacterized membrane protein YjgN (DUF898 family)